MTCSKTRFVRDALRLAMLLWLVGCGGDGGVPTGASEGDAGANSDAGMPLADAGTESDAQMSDQDDPADKADAGDDMPDDMMDTMGPDDMMGMDEGPDPKDEPMPPAAPTNAGLLSDYRTCDVTTDCPIGVCVTELPLNRPDADGTTSISVKSLWPDLPAKGLCTTTCSSSPAECDTLKLSDRNDGKDYAFSCQLVALGADPYAHSETAYPYDVSASELARGQAFAALCRPPFGRHSDRLTSLCDSCTSDSDCGDGGTCAAGDGTALGDGAMGVCLEACGDSDGCLPGFACESSTMLCAPATGTCGSCVDPDGDGYGIGFCTDTGDTTAYDCDEADPGVYFAAPVAEDTRFEQACATADINCNGLADDSEVVGPGPFGDFHCTGCFDACDGTMDNGELRCVRDPNTTVESCELVCEDGFADCDPSVDGCETPVTDPNRLYYPDSDMDGAGDINGKSFFDCDGLGVPANHVKVASPADSDCDDNDPYSYPGNVEVCDNRDSDCNGTVDDSPPVGMSCSVGGQQGQCAASQFTCQGAPDGGAPICPQVNTPSSNDDCNNLDDDCDGTVDNITGVCSDPMGVGRCAYGVRACAAGAEVCNFNGPAIDYPLFRTYPTRPGAEDEDCDGIDGSLVNSVFVAVNGDPSPSAGGTASDPFRTLAQALAVVNVPHQTAKHTIFLEKGTFKHDATIVPQNNFWIVGNMNRQGSTGSTWTHDATGKTTIEVTAPIGIDHRPIPNFTSGRNTYWHRIKIKMKQDASGGNYHSIGLYCDGCGSQLQFYDVDIEAADGKDGEGGSAFTGLAKPSSSTELANAAGKQGAAGFCFRCSAGGAGGVTTCGSWTSNGGLGGDGFYNDTIQGSVGGTDGGRGFNSFSAPGSSALELGGLGGVANRTWYGDAASGDDGPRGLPSAAGQPGARQSMLASPTYAAPGGTGFVGGAGGGGAGGNRSGLDAGGGGGGGGAGGCGGGGGSGARGGGTSIGAYLVNSFSAQAMFRRDVSVSAGRGGAGGMGGMGGKGGQGGARGPNQSQYGSPSGYGGWGTGGGGGGGGGGGAGGNSFGVVVDAPRAAHDSVFQGLTAGGELTISCAGAGPGGLGGMGGAGGDPSVTMVGNVTGPESTRGRPGSTGRNGVTGVACLQQNVTYQFDPNL